MNDDGFSFCALGTMAFTWNGEYENGTPFTLTIDDAGNGITSSILTDWF